MPRFQDFPEVCPHCGENDIEQCDEGAADSDGSDITFICTCMGCQFQWRTFYVFSHWEPMVISPGDGDED